ncbi:ATP-binding protein [Lentibacillus cibarius]|uniref:IstB-like ATP-binding domain-containing protein n=1 Tax=Lentibacillus cibarius TaxID=2583219 RepID=A0A5S3QKY2_9BACI|nr:ATP-binding protein [Lentibacillus cibarius]TMN21871.1 hypothetical protein FFL34_06890 [Lentibacillus cibarius]
MALGIANALIQKYHVQPIYISTVNLLNEVKKTYNQGPKTSSQSLVEFFKEARVLVFDDLGLEKTTDWSEEKITEILEERMNNKRPTIITSNIPVQELTNKYPAGRVESRLEKMTFPVTMAEESVRRLIAQKENDKIAEMFFE